MRSALFSDRKRRSGRPSFARPRSKLIDRRKTRARMGVSRRGWRRPTASMARRRGCHNGAAGRATAAIRRLCVRSDRHHQGAVLRLWPDAGGGSASTAQAEWLLQCLESVSQLTPGTRIAARAAPAPCRLAIWAGWDGSIRQILPSGQLHAAGIALTRLDEELHAHARLVHLAFRPIHKGQLPPASWLLIPPPDLYGVFEAE